MLHREALPPGTLDLLTTLSADPVLANFALVGGTSLALRLGHRRSVDLDWFTREPFDSAALAEKLKQSHEFKAVRQFENGLMCVLNGIRCDFAIYRYALLEPPENIEGVRMWSLPDVIGMKLGAVTNRGAKKDFYDMHALILKLGLAALIEIYRRKYPDHDPVIVLRSLCYFEDAEKTDEPVSMVGTTWSEVKNAVSEAVYQMTRP